MKNHTLQAVLALFATILVGCAIVGAGHQYDIKTITYSPLPIPKNSETRVFVFRGKNLTGAANRFVVIDNDTVVGALDSGSFTSFIAKGDRNVIVAQIPIEGGIRGYFYFEGRKGEDIYLYFKLVMSEELTLKEIPREEASKLISKYDYLEMQAIPNPKWHINFLDYYDRLQKQKTN